MTPAPKIASGCPLEVEYRFSHRVPARPPTTSWRAHQLSNLHGVQRCALTQVVVRDEHDQTLAGRRCLVSPNPPDETRILTRGIERRWYLDQPNARSASQQLRRLVRTEIFCELCVDSERMPGENRHAYAGAGDAKIGNVQDLPRLIAQLLLLVGLARTVVDERAGQRKDVVGNGLDVLVRRREVDGVAVEGELDRLIDHGPCLAVELLDACAT